MNLGRRPGLAWGDVHVWWVTLGQHAGGERRASSVLAADEIRRAHAYRSAEAGRSYVQHRAALRYILAVHLGSVAAELRFGSEAHGRPTLEHPAHDGVRFSVSRSDGLGVVVVGRGVDVGVDVEHRRPDLPFQAIAAIAFPIAERSRLASSANHAQTFFDTWTRMEAGLKLAGIGLAEEEQRRGDAVHDAHLTVVGAEYVTLDAGPAHVAALAVCPRPARVLVHHWGSSSALATTRSDRPHRGCA